ncbi:MAG: alpha/beta fold hydrolase [Anaerolineae bacterium]|nr:alpha/beta fold hydrolase [Anaerolineae bacterium]
MAELEKQLESDPEALGLAELVGEKEAEEIAASARAPKARGVREAVVVLPGIMGSLLFSVRGVTTLLWVNPLLFLEGHGGYLRVGEQGSQIGAPEVDCAAFSLEKLTYMKLVISLRRKFTVFEFPYDWRLPIETNADELARCIQRWSGGDAKMQFALVAHSMGGLVSRTYLARHTQEAEQRIKRVITLGTPHLGATSAIDNLFNGNSMMAVVDKLNSDNGMREVILSMPSVYQLLPAPKVVFPSGMDYPVDFDLYRAEEWGVEGIRQEYLDMARRLYGLLAVSDPQVELIQIAGCHISTMTKASLVNDAGKKKVAFTSFDEGAQSGDGTVPGWSGNFKKARLFFAQATHRDLPGNRDVINAVEGLIISGDCSLNTRIPKKKVGLFGKPGPVAPASRAAVIEDKVKDGTITSAELGDLFFAM